MNKIYIDTKTGTWGNLTDLVTIDLDEHFPRNSKVNAEKVLENLSNSSDQEIISIGHNYGQEVTN